MYNQPLTEFLTFVVTFFLGSATLVGLLYGLFAGAKPIKFSDNFDLGYIRDNDPSKTIEVEAEKDELEELKRQVEIAKLRKQLKELQNPTADDSLMKDCVDALVGLGTPARKAKTEAQTIFDKNPSIKTVQEFITEHGKR